MDSDGDVVGAISRALESRSVLAALALLAEKDLARLEALYLKLSKAGARREDISSLRRTVAAAVRTRKVPVAASIGDEENEGNVKRLADAICQTAHFAQDLGAKLYLYSHGVYVPYGSATVKRQVKALLLEWDLNAAWSSRLADEVVEYIRVDAPELWERPPLDTLNVLNGLLNLDTRQLSPHSPNYLSPVQLPVVYYPTATCPAWDRFVIEVFPQDAWEFAWEAVGWLMAPDTSMQKAVLLVGWGGNGKSTWLDVVRTFLGHSNISSVPLHMLEQNRFSVARLVGKLANICADLPSEQLWSTFTFNAITGGDTLSGEYKFKDSFDFLPFARLVFSANQMPLSTDDSDAFFARWIVVPFEKEFRGTDLEVPRHVLDARLAAPVELSGVLNQALIGLTNLRVRTKFLEPDSVVDASAEFRTITDPLGVWLGERTVELADAYVPKKTLLAAYNKAATHEKRPPMTESGFGRA